MNPLRTNNILIRFRQNQFKRLVSDLSIILKTHRTSPFLISHGLVNGGGDRDVRFGDSGCKGKLFGRLGNVVFGSCFHWMGV